MVSFSPIADTNAIGLIDMTSIHKDDKAVSETIGFILIFAIVLTCIGIILLYGNQVLDVTKNENNFQSIQQGFIVLQSDLQQVALEQTPVKTSMIHLEDGTVFFNSTQGALTITDDASGHHQYYLNNTGWLTYLSGHDRSQVSIENGGLWMHYDEPSNYAVITTPRIYATTDAQGSITVVVNVIRFIGNDQAKSGPRTLSIRMEPNDTNVYTYSMDDGSLLSNAIDLSYVTNHPYAWDACLNDTDNLYSNSFDSLSPEIISSPPTGIPATTTFKLSNVKTLIISEHDIDVALN
jgi:hypothetical protein